MPVTITRATTKVKVPQPVGIRLEIARAGGLTEEALIEAIRDKRIESLQRVGPEQLPWDILIEYGEQYPAELERAIREGYEFKFLTIRGLTSYLHYRFGLKEPSDYRIVDEALEGIRLNASDIALLEATIPAFWHIAEGAIGTERGADGDDNPDEITIRIERLHHNAIRFEGGEAG